MFIDYKKTVWERIKISDDCNLSESQIINLINKRQQENAFLWDEINPEPEWEPIYESGEYITPEDNAGQSTIEAYSDDGILLYENGTNTKKL
jgi:hypothetical protein